MKKLSSFAVIALLFVSMLSVTFNVRSARAIGTIYIRADGSIDPLDASILRDGDLYTLIDNIASVNGIVIERDNIVVDGAGYSLIGGGSRGINLAGRNNVTIRNTNINGFSYGIYLSDSSGNTISGNNITNNWEGIHSARNSLYNIISRNNISCVSGIGIGFDEYSSYNVISENKIINNLYGIFFYKRNNNNVISRNTIRCDDNTGTGILLQESSDNIIFGNNITAQQEGIIFCFLSYYNIIYGNNITNNGNGITLCESHYNTIRENNITANTYGVLFLPCEPYQKNNRFYHNNFVDNYEQVCMIEDSYPGNFWNDNYPSGGNYWSDYTDVDVKKGPGQDLPGSDNIGDTPYTIDANNFDRYPLMNPCSPSLPTYTLTITTTIDGITNPASGVYNYTIYSTIQVKAIPITNYKLHHWELDGHNIGSINPYIVTIDTNHTLTAVFSPIPLFLLTIVSSPTGISFVVDSNTSLTPWSRTYYEGTLVSLEMPQIHSIGEARYYWSQWSDGVSSRSRTVTVKKNITLTAYYNGPYYELNVTSSPVTGVTFTINGTLETTPYSEWLLEGSYTLVMPEIHSVGAARYYWNQWNDEVASRSRTVTMSTNITLAAQYTGPYYQLTVTSSPITGILFTINGTQKTTPYTEWLLEASYTLVMPETHNDYVWSHWLQDGDTSRTKMFILTGNTTWTGVFVPAPKPPVGGYSFQTEGYTTANPPIPYLALMAIIISSFAIAKRKILRKRR